MHYYKGGKGGRPSTIGAWIRGHPFTFIVPLGLFSSKKVDKGTLLLAEMMEIPKEGRALDVGCGYGVLGIVMAKMNPSLDVIMTDVNPKAVEAAKKNVELNSVKATVLLGDLYEAVDGLGIKDFATIVSNPPLSAGREVVQKIIEGAAERLAPGGVLQMVFAQGGEWAEGLMRSIFSEVDRKKKKGYVVLKAYL
ncbi:MAG: class I SAM-dependent methyltransferase [Crenarchaeota archaeon]|nr:class I SAM-dependent methyltransferase [Thermoproteota archaeon]